MDPDVVAFARSFHRFIEAMAELARTGEEPPLRAALDAHLGTDSSGLPVIAESFPSYDHANVQIALTAYLEREGRSHSVLGITGSARHHGSLSDLLEADRYGAVRLGSVEHVNVPVGPDSTLACVQFGLFLISDQGDPIAVLARGQNEMSNQEEIKLEVLSADAERARAFLDEIRHLIVERNVFRGKVVSFGESRMGHFGIGPMIFHHRPDAERDGLVLAPGVLESIERQVLAIAEHRDRLRASGQHVKRGLLLHGPPGTGKTHTIRYLTAAALDHTVLLLTGGGLQMVRAACGLARLLQPSLIVLEDVDLVAEHRMAYPGHTNPVLFDVLNEMDGIAGDADVAFLLTTNRADLLEPALAARPGRVDLAVEIALPDDDARRRLIALYGRGLDLRLSDVEPFVDRTSGATASFVKELMRKAALIAAVTGNGTGRLTVTDEHLDAALGELLQEGSTLTRVLLGGQTPDRGSTDWIWPDGGISPD